MVGLIPTLEAKRQMLDMSLEEKIQKTRGLDQAGALRELKDLAQVPGPAYPSAGEPCIFNDPSPTREVWPRCRRKTYLQSNSSESPEPALAPHGGAHLGDVGVLSGKSTLAQTWQKLKMTSSKPGPVDAGGSTEKGQVFCTSTKCEDMNVIKSGSKFHC